MKKISIVFLFVFCFVLESLAQLSVGGYGEAVMTRNFYSDSWQRYIKPEDYASDESHGRFDLPHFVVNLGYDFGQGWTMSSEIEFEHGGTESAVEMEADEAGEYESEIERGGEVALEQFWIQKSWNKALNLRMGHIIVPVGLTNQYHLPVEFFTNYRQEGESTIFPCTWHETGLSLWGRLGRWRYEWQFLAGLDSDRFGSANFIAGGAGSPYEFKIANNYATAMRHDFYLPMGLRLGLSGYYGHSFDNSLRKNKKYQDCKGEVMIGAFDFHYDAHHLVVRGNVDYAHLNDSYEITQFNKSMSSDSPSPHQNVASDALSASIQVGYDVFAHVPAMKKDKKKLYVFAHYEFYDSMFKTVKADMDYPQYARHRMAAGINYYPMNEIVIKAEYSKRFLVEPFIDEPSVSLGIAYCGFFTRK